MLHFFKIMIMHLDQWKSQYGNYTFQPNHKVSYKKKFIIKQTNDKVGYKFPTGARLLS